MQHKLNEVFHLTQSVQFVLDHKFLNAFRNIASEIRVVCTVQILKMNVQGYK